MEYVIGIDGGGTKTRCLVAHPDGTVLGEGVGGPSNLVTVGLEAARAALEEGVLAASIKAGVVPGDRCTAVCAGLAGVASGAGRNQVRLALADMTGAGRVEVTTDLHIALAGALPVGPGLLVVAGTGSAALGRDRRGEIHRAGGLGYLLGDEGGGYWIVREAVKAVLRAAEGRGRATDLAGRLEPHRGEASWPLFFKESTPGAVAALFPAVAAAADGGDTVALGILHWAGTELAELAGNLARRLREADPEGEELLPATRTGSILERSAPVREAFGSRLGEFNLAPTEAVGGPAEGAVRLAAGDPRES